jgi:hypothetical protein
MIIAFSGRMKSGKDTAADFLVELRGFHRMAFADNLKKMCMHVFGLTEYQCYTQKGKERKLVAPIKATTNSVHEVAVWCIQENFWKVTDEHYKKMTNALVDRKFTTPREILQYMGTEVLRQCIDDDYHSKVLNNMMQAKGYENVVISDCRFPNEVDAVNKWDGKCINIERPLLEETTGIEGHASENALNDYTFDHVINNDGSMEDFKKKVLEMI